MTSPTDPTPARASRLRVPLFVFLGCVALTVVAFVVADNTPRTTEPAAPPPDQTGSSAKFRTPTYPGVRQPPTVSAAAAGLKDDEEVVGVIAGGKARAYRLQTMRGLPQEHVVNDLIAETPVTVTYCDINRCVKVYTANAKEALDIAVNGFQADGMILSVNGHQVRQETGRPVDPKTPVPPLTEYQFERTTWKKWREAHPDTDVYVGAAGAGK